MFNKGARRRIIRHRIRKKIFGTAEMPRMAVYRSNKEIYCQLIDDLKGHTLASASSKGVSGATRVEKAAAVGKLIAEKAKAKNIDKVYFDRGGYLYHGRVKAMAEGAREGGLTL